MFVYIEQNYIGEIPRWVVNLVSWNELEGVPTNAEDLSLVTHPTQKNHFQEPKPIALSVINNKGRNWSSKGNSYILNNETAEAVADEQKRSLIML